MRDKKAEFVPVETGIAGTTDIEVTQGHQRRVTRSLLAATKFCELCKPGTSVKIDNTAPKKKDEEELRKRLSSGR